MLTDQINDARAWTAATLDDQSSWFYPLPRDLLDALASTIEKLRKQPRPLIELNAGDSSCSGFSDSLLPVRAALERGRGFAILDGLPYERYSRHELQAIYWLVGQLLGRPCAQNVQGTLLYDVRDTGQDLAQGARFSVTSYESSFHTDNSFGEGLVDYVGLLCLQSARSGGLSQVVSGYAAHNRLRADHADVLPILYEPFHIDRRGGVRPGEDPTIRKPVLAWGGRELSCRYLRYWIHSGHEKAGKPLTPEQLHAFDVLDSVLRQRDLAAEFMLRPGQMFFINNRWIFHNRTAFEDYAEVERRRHYVRLWLVCDQDAAGLHARGNCDG
jgi:alpha-ketoglutarate-dependent taurine dioxygenase